MGSIISVLKIAANRSGISYEEYISNIAKGEKYCWKCNIWKSKDRFGVDVSRGDRLASACFDCRRKTGKPKTILTDNKRQARNAVNDAIRKGRMLAANNLPCLDCGNNAKEYHHHINYDKSNWLNVQPLCKKCHNNRH